MLPTPSVTMVKRATGADGFEFMGILLEQAELFSATLGPCEMIRGQFGPALVEPKLFAGDLEPAPDHPGHRACALHPRPPLRVVVATVSHVADQSEDVAIAIRIIRHQPLAKEIAHFER